MQRCNEATGLHQHNDGEPVKATSPPRSHARAWERTSGRSASRPRPASAFQGPSGGLTPPGYLSGRGASGRPFPRGAWERGTKGKKIRKAPATGPPLPDPAPLGCRADGRPPPPAGPTGTPGGPGRRRGAELPDRFPRGGRRWPGSAESSSRELQPQQLHALDRLGAPGGRLPPLQPGCLGHDRPGPGLRSKRRDWVSSSAAALRQRAAVGRTGRLSETAGPRCDDPVQEGAEAGGRRRLPATSHRSPLAETLDEDLLRRVVHIEPQARAAPAGGQVGADDAEVAAGQLVPIGRAARGRGPDDGPTGGFRRGNFHTGARRDLLRGPSFLEAGRGRCGGAGRDRELSPTSRGASRGSDPVFGPSRWLTPAGEVLYDPDTGEQGGAGPRLLPRVAVSLSRAFFPDRTRSVMHPVGAGEVEPPSRLRYSLPRDNRFGPPPGHVPSAAPRRDPPGRPRSPAGERDAAAQSTQGRHPAAPPPPVPRHARRRRVRLGRLGRDPLLLALVYLVKFSSPLPCFDDWTLVPVLTGARPLTPAYLWEPFNEHREPLPKLVLNALGRLSGFDFRAGMFLNVLLLAGLAAAMLRTARRLRGSCHFADAFFPLVVLSLAQWECFLMQFALNLVCSTVCAGVFLVELAGRSTRACRRGGSCGWPAAWSRCRCPAPAAWPSSRPWPGGWPSWASSRAGPPTPSCAGGAAALGLVAVVLGLSGLYLVGLPPSQPGPAASCFAAADGAARPAGGRHVLFGRGPSFPGRCCGPRWSR